MPSYVIGDVQGCYKTFRKLLEVIKFDPQTDKVFLLGDLVNRGPDSLSVLRFRKANDLSIRAVLGNHDIRAIAEYLHCAENLKPHTLGELMAAPDAKELIDWLRAQPIILPIDKKIFVHAGIFPGFTINKSIEYANEISHILKSDNAKQFLKNYYKSLFTEMPDPNNREDVLRFALGANIYMRMCLGKNKLDRTYDGELKNAPSGLTPWFYLSTISDHEIYFGHWSALGFFNYKNFTCLDTGCVWGRTLSALRLEDKKLFSAQNIE